MANAIDLDFSSGSFSQPRSLLTLRSLQDAATKLADLKNTPRGLGTRSLIGLLICQAQRNRRMSLEPVRIHLRVASRDGSAAVKLRLGATNI
ncbi:hypothetical protein [Bartonella sp. LJL80]